jgi:hypothetical protein
MLGRDIAKFADEKLADKRAAYDYLAKHHEKWEPAIAVSFMEGRNKRWLIGGWCSS